jgi:hypothetical protein
VPRVVDPRRALLRNPFRRPKCQESGAIPLGEDYVLVPEEVADQIDPPRSHGATPTPRILDRVGDETVGTFVIVNVRAVEAELERWADEHPYASEADRKAETEAAFNNPLHWMPDDYDTAADEDEDEDEKWSFFRLDPSTGRIGGD